jgi:putative transcriptional regulator
MDGGSHRGGLRRPDAEADRHRQVRSILPHLRAERGWTQGDLARELHVSRQTVNAIETGRYEASLPLAFKIAKLFAKSIEDIFQS